MKELLNKLMLLLTAPLRWAVRYELLNRQVPSTAQDIGIILQRRAAEATATYVQKCMSDVDSVSSNLDVLSLALEKANLCSNEIICEFGVHSGITINHIASLTNHTVYGFDSFEGLPERWRDGFGKGTFKVSNLPQVANNVVLIQGWFHETLPKFIKNNQHPVGFLHVDCDLYSSTKIIFDALSDRIGPGCVIVFDEYFNYPQWEEGEFKAFGEFVRRTGAKYEYICYNRLHEQVAVRITAR